MCDFSVGRVGSDLDTEGQDLHSAWLPDSQVGKRRGPDWARRCRRQEEVSRGQCQTAGGRAPMGTPLGAKASLWGWWQRARPGSGPGRGERTRAKPKMLARPRSCPSFHSSFTPKAQEGTSGCSTKGRHSPGTGRGQRSPFQLGAVSEGRGDMTNTLLHEQRWPTPVCIHRPQTCPQVRADNAAGA